MNASRESSSKRINLECIVLVTMVRLSDTRPGTWSSYSVHSTSMETGDLLTAAADSSYDTCVHTTP